MKIDKQKQKQFQGNQKDGESLIPRNQKRQPPTVKSNLKDITKNLDKFSFEDHDYSKTYEEIMHNQHPENQDNDKNQTNWLRLSVKGISTIGKQLITFFLQVKYQVWYRTDSTDFKKKKLGQQDLYPLKSQVKQTRSKLIHGSILQNESQQLVLTLKARNFRESRIKNQQLFDPQPQLTNIQFSLIRIVESKKQGKIIAKQLISNPKVNKQYEIQFQQLQTKKGQKPRPIAQMTFEINYQIQQQSFLEQSEFQSQAQNQSQIPQHLEDFPQVQTAQNYTLGLSKKQQGKNSYQSKKASKPSDANIFDHDSKQKRCQSQVSQSNSQNHGQTVVKKFNQLSRMIDSNLQKSKNDDAIFKNYLEQTTNFLEQLKVNKSVINEQQNTDKKVRQLNQKFENKNRNKKQNKNKVKKDNVDLNQQNNQAYSRWIPNSLSQLDSSNIRYKYDQNQLSNIEQTKDMQAIINTIQLIQKQWYEKKFMDRQNNSKIKLIQKKLIQNKQAINLLDIRDKDRYMDLELNKFKIKFSQENFYKRLLKSIKNRHLRNTKNNQTEKSALNMPKNYILNLIAYETSDNKLSFYKQELQRSQIRIPYQHINKLIELEAIQKQHDPHDKLRGELSYSAVSKSLQNKIIKELQKQVYSKVIRVKISKQNEGEVIGKNKTRIIEIVLQIVKCEFQNMDQKDGLKSEMNLIGMYILPVFDEQQKDLQTSFYQNASIQALSIIMYNQETGVREGEIFFQLKKARQDKQIQTLQQLKDIGQKQFQDVAKDDFKQITKNEQNQRGGNKLTENVDEFKNQQQREEKQSYMQYVSKDQNLQKVKPDLRNQIYGEKSKRISPVLNPFRSQILQNVSKNKEQINLNRQPQSNSSQHLAGKIVKNILTNLQQKVVQPFPIQQNHSEIKKVPAIILDIMNKKQSQAKSQKYEPRLLRHPPQQLPLPIKLLEIQQNYTKNQNFGQIQSWTPKSSPSSYQQMKQQFNQTSNIISNLKFKAQRFIQQRQGQFIKPVRNRYNIKSQEKFFSNGSQNKKPQSLSVESLVFNQVILAKKKKSRNTNHYANIQQKINDKIQNAQNDFTNSHEGGRIVNYQLKGRISRQKNNQKQIQNKLQVLLIEKNVKRGKTKMSYQQKQQNEYDFIQEQDIASPIQLMNNQVLPKNKDKKVHHQGSLRNQRGVNTPKQIEDSDCDELNSRQPILNNSKQLMLNRQGRQGRQGYNQEQHYQQLNYRQPLKMNRADFSYLKNRQQGIQVDLCFVKIKLSAPPQVSKIELSNCHRQGVKSQSFFILIYTDLMQNYVHDERKGKDRQSKYTAPMMQKCFVKQDSKQDQLVVIFNVQCQSQSNKRKEGLNLLPLRGFQTNKVYIQLYRSEVGVDMEGIYNEEQYYYEQQRLGKINLVTSSSMNIKGGPFNNVNQPIGSVSVTFLELSAQLGSNDNSQKDYNLNFNGRRQNSSMIYTNFLYNKQKIAGKINLKYYLSEGTRKSGEQSKRAESYELADQQLHRFNYQSQIRNLNKKVSSLHRYSASYEYKPQRIAINKNSRKDQGIYDAPRRQNDNHSQQEQSQTNGLNSESGITKRTSTKRRNIYQKGNQLSQPSRNLTPNAETAFKRPDPLQILKRRVPKPLKKFDHTNKDHPHSYQTAVNKPYYDSSVKRNSYVSLASSSLVKSTTKKMKKYEKKHTESELSQNHEGRHNAHLYKQSPDDEIIQQGQSPKKVLNLRDKDLPQLRSRKQQKKLEKLESYKKNSRIVPLKTQDTRASQNKNYQGGNIRFGKSSRFILDSDSKQIQGKSPTRQIPGPGQYEVKSIFERHTVKQP